jgi:cupin fold WbuC family metalloprotein
MADVQLISTTLFEAVGDAAAASPRLRMNHNFHAGAGDNPHRLLNVLVAGTYIQPHRHLHPPKAESFLVLEGAADVFVFDDAGTVTARYRLGSDGLWGVDLPAGTWHTILPRSARAVCYEVKPGPWDPGTDKEFADWAPAEGDPAAAEYVQRLLESK